MKKDTYTIDAEGKSIGRVASEAAVCLLGKTKPDFKKHVLPNVEVKIVNTAKLRIAPKKMRSKTYARYSGHPGGLKKPRMELVIGKRGMKEIVSHAVWGMLPKNTLRKRRMKQLTILE